MTSVRALFAQASDLAVQFTAWWFSELSSMFPWLTLRRFKPAPPLLRVGKQHCSLLLDSSGIPSSAEIASAAVELPGQYQLASDASKLRKVCAGRSLDVSMSDEDILTLEYELPVAARGELDKAVSYKLLTESPIDPSLVLYAAKSRRDASTPQHLRLDVVISRKKAVEEVRTILGNCGVPVNNVGYALPGSRALDFVFRTSEMQKTVQARKRMHLYLLVAAMATFTAYFPVTAIMAKWLERDARGQILALKATDKRQVELEARQSRVQTIRQELAHELPPFRMTSLINAVAGQLPNDAWVNRLEYRNGKVSLSGQAADPSAIVRQLKRASVLSSAKLDAVSSATNPGDPPQFEISLAVPGGQN